MDEEKLNNTVGVGKNSVCQFQVECQEFLAGSTEIKSERVKQRFCTGN